MGCMLLMLGTAGLAGAQAVDADAVTEAVWKTQQMDFEYRSDRTYYSCSALQEKLRRILMEMGARRDILVSPYACITEIGIARFRVVLRSPVPATEENVRELTSYDTRDELAARVRGEHLFTAEELPRFAAEWRTISFARDRKLKLAAGDCELVQQLRRQVLPRLSVNVVKEVPCSSAARILAPPRLTVSALVAMPPPDSLAE